MWSGSKKKKTLGPAQVRERNERLLVSQEHYTHQLIETPCGGIYPDDGMLGAVRFCGAGGKLHFKYDGLQVAYDRLQKKLGERRFGGAALEKGAREGDMGMEEQDVWKIRGSSEAKRRRR